MLDAIVIGAGQAGLALSRELGVRGLDHAVLEKGKVGQAWRDRWDSFCLVTPNWTVNLPGHPYDRDDPDGFMPRDEIVEYLERYVAAVGVPVRENTPARKVMSGKGGFTVETDGEEFTAQHLILATGAFQRPVRPKSADTLPARIKKMGLGDYTNPGDLALGGVLIIGSGQSGCQLAEEIQDSGRDVTLACGRAPWSPRMIGGKDIVWWAHHGGFYDVPVADLPPEARLYANVLVTGHDGGRDMNFRTLADRGIRLTGHFIEARGDTAHFEDDLAESVAWGDGVYQQLTGFFSKTAEKLGLPDPGLGDPSPWTYEAPTELNLAGVDTVIFTTGFRPDFASWLPWPEAFDDHGFPVQVDGSSTVVPGLHFLGTHFLRTRRSSLLSGVGTDAAQLAERIAG